MKTKLVDILKSHQLRKKEVLKKIDLEKQAEIKAKWDAAIARATGPEMREKMLKGVEQNPNQKVYSFVVASTEDIPNYKGGGVYEIPLNGGGNLFCAIRDKKITDGTVFHWYPPLQVIKDYYEREGFFVNIEANYDSGGIKDWLELVVYFNS